MGQLFYAQYALLAAVLTRTPTVAVVHGIIPRNSRRQDVLVHRMMRKVQVVAGVSAFVCRSLEEEYGRPKGSSPVLHNGIEDTGLSQVSVQRGDPGTTVLGAVGRCAPEKGFDVLLRAMVELPDCHLVIVGEGPQRDELAALARELGIEDRLTFTGWIDPPWVSAIAFDIVVVPSRVEGFGLVAVEAMLAGMPVVGSRVGGLPEVVTDGVNGLLVEPENPSALAGSIRQLADDPERRKVLAQAGRASMVDRYTTTAQGEAYARVFDETRRR